ncbi:MAG: hypothetical protein ABIR80_05275 [Opitutaceae bacterium]
MNNEEAKFNLGAYRPDGRDAGDPAFAAPLAQAERDPELRVWLERQRKFDATVADKLGEIAPPAGLREAILAGGRASQPRRRWWTNPAWLAAAAAIAIVATLAVGVKLSRAVPTVSELAAFGLRDVGEAYDKHDGFPPGLADVQAQFASARLPMTDHLRLDLDELRKKNCRTVRVGGREVFEVCFQRDGAWYHIYAARRGDFTPGAIDPKASIATRGQLASMAWADAKVVYALVTDGGVEALRRVI